jgi:hypothetical protein
MNTKKIFQEQKSLYIKDVINKDVSNLLTHCLMRAKYYDTGKIDDIQVPGCLGILDHEVLFETVHEHIWPAIELVIGEPLLPTYSYARLYANGNELKKHSDRESCEISITVQLGRSHNYSWPIYMGNKRYDLAEGDGVIYKGCDIEHWRNVCDGPEDYYSGQAFFHFVKANGANAPFKNDKRPKLENQGYIKHRNFLMLSK